MDLFLQFGHGMMAHTEALLGDWGGGSVVLSPRDLDEEQLQRMGSKVAKKAGSSLVDPQCYVRDADHTRLVEHDYWKVYASHTTGAFLGGPGTTDLLSALAALNAKVGTQTAILPGLLADVVDDDWFAFQRHVIDESASHFPSHQRLMTIALSSDAVRSEDQIEAVVERSEDWDVDGFYVVPETPGAYLVDDPTWLSNVLLLTAGLKLQGRTVVLGYANHQLLSAAATGVDAICSGTWMNVRAFSPAKFMKPDGSIKRKAVWYYAPNALSEFKVPFLDIAHRQGVLDVVRPPAGFPTGPSNPLFSGVQPGSVGWGERPSFRHYLSTLRHQAHLARAGGFDAALGHQEASLDEAESALESLHDAGVRGQNRDFADFIDVNRAALAVLKSSRGALLRRRWPH